MILPMDVFTSAGPWLYPLLTVLAVTLGLWLFTASLVAWLVLGLVLNRRGTR